jgi:phosphatidylserine/phosphatidylglycerophosphate/cardiolipin synthase-like enzyme
MYTKAHKSIRAKTYFLLIIVFACLGCQSRVVRKAAETIVRDATLTCPPETTNRCAIPSEFQDIADSAFQGHAPEGTHYVSILDVGEDALLVRIHLIRAARESIEIQTFIWEDDEVGQVMFKELLEAARRGVKVRIILDQFGAYMPVGVIAQIATAHENIDMMFFRPVMKKGGKSATREIGCFVTDPKTLNKRMHNKLFVVDGRIGIVGGRNIQNSYYDYDSSICFKDLDLLVAGPEVGDMVKSFNKYWGHKLTKPVLELPDIANQAIRLQSQGRQLLFADPDISDLKALLKKASSYSIVEQRPAIGLYTVDHVDYVADWPEKRNPLGKSDRWNSTRRVEELVTSAQYEILMQTPYLIQDRKGFRDFKTLRKEHPDMRIALSTNSLGSTDMFYVYAMCFKQRQFYLEAIEAHMYEFKPRPADAEVIVPRYSKLVRELNDIDPYETQEAVLPVNAKKPRLILHSKFFVVDKYISFVGSHNFDPRAKSLNTENAVIIWDNELAEALEAIFDRDTAPQNSWVVARRQKIPLVGNASELIAAISSSLPFFDVWPFEYSTNFELKDGFEPLSPDHSDFYEHYKDVGVFPQKGLSYENVGTRFIKAFGGLFRDIM